jgi:hypothetical protein
MVYVAKDRAGQLGETEPPKPQELLIMVVESHIT